MKASSIGRTTTFGRKLPMMRHLQLGVILAMGMLLLCGSSLRAQTDPNIEQGIKPYAPLHGGDIDAVNLTNGHLTVSIPFYSLPQRGGKLRYDLKIFYDHPGFVVQSFCAPPPSHSCIWRVEYTPQRITSPSVGFIDNLSFVIHTDNADSGFQDCCGNEIFFPMYSLRAADGSSHQLALTQDATHYETIDGTGFRVEASTDSTHAASGAITDSSGVRYPGGNVAAEDPNGNQILRDPSTGALTDTLGRTANGTTSSTSTSACPNLNFQFQSVASATLWSLPGVNGPGNFPVTLCYANVYVRTSLCGSISHCTELFTGQSSLQSVVLPNGTYWAFQYDAADPNNSASIKYGDLTKIILPTGGSISYANQPQFNVCLNSNPTMNLPYRNMVASRSVDANDGTGPHTWTYAWGTPTQSGTVNNVTDPLGQKTVHTITDLSGCAMYETQVQSYDSSSNLVKTVNTDYSFAADPFASDLGTPMSAGVVPIRTTTTWPNSQMAKTETDYDSGFTYKDPTWIEAVICPMSCVPNNVTYTVTYGRPIAIREYDYGSGAPGSLLRQSLTSYLWQSNSNYLQYNLLNLPSSVTVKDGGGTQRALTNYGYDASSPGLNPSGVTTSFDTNPPNGATRGNQTSVSRWLNTTGGYLTTNVQFNDTGTVYKSTDPGNHTTTFSYSLNYAGGYVTQTQFPDTNSPNLAHHVISGAYDLSTGLLTSLTDQNGNTSNYSYDSMTRLSSVSFPDGGQITFTPHETSFPFNVVRTQKINASQNLVNTYVFDGVGRVTQTQLNSDPDGVTYVDTTYDGLGRKATVSNPYRSTSDSTYGITTYNYDALNRLTKLIPPDGSSSADNVTTTYSGNCTTVTDEAGKVRKSCADGLGRLTTVWEDPSGLNYETDYQYDTLDNLTSVTQNGSRQRAFVYNSLSQLTSSTNPESNTVPSTGATVATTYSYDNDGNLSQKTMPAQNQQSASTVTLTYCYDALNRLTAKGYMAQTCTNGTMPSPVATYLYDQTSYNGLTIMNGIGRRSGMTDTAGAEAWSYDVMGRPLVDQRTTNSVTKTTTYTYLPYVDGSLYQLTYASGRTITYATGGAERLLSAVDSGNSINYALSATYAPQGAFASAVVGQTGSFGGINLNFGYDKRLQPTTMRGWSTNGTALDLAYNFNLGTLDNGNVIGITNNRDGTRSQAFTYDSLNRILVGETTSTYATSPGNCWGETYLYDNQTTGGAWGNLTNINAASTAYNGCTEESLSITANAQNRIGTSGYVYDTAGNLTNTPNPGGVTAQYSAENQLTTANGTGYTYDGDGKRVQKSNGTLYWYGMNGDALDETDLSGNLTNEYVFFGGKRIARRDASNNVFYYFSDHLGTSRVITNATGSVCYDADFYPFGGERPPILNICPQNYKFASKERDLESNLDEFGARYYSSAIGRFMTPDWAANPSPVPYASVANPQTFNLYSYVLNNPMTLNDPAGHETGYQYPSPGVMVGPNEPGFVRSDHPILDTLLLGAAAGASLFAPEAGPVLRGLFGLGLATAPKTLPIVVSALEGLTPGPQGTLTISAAPRLSANEISTGVRLAEQEGLRLVQSEHVGSEFVDAAGKTYDAMGGGKAFEHFGGGGKFFESIVQHVNKSVNKVAIDLKGASKDQVSAIKDFVKTLTKEQQKKVIYVK